MLFNEKLIMEKELNIAAILKDKPQGTKLYDWLHNIDVELDTYQYYRYRNSSLVYE